MKPLRDNFREGAPISQVPATWFNAVASFINSLIPGFGISWAKSEKMNIIEVDQSVIPGKTTGTPVSGGSFPTNDGITQTAGNIWTAGGANGLTLEVLFKGEYDSNLGVHKVYSATLTFSKDGLLMSADKIGNGGMMIGA